MCMALDGWLVLATDQCRCSSQQFAAAVLYSLSLHAVAYSMRVQCVPVTVLYVYGRSTDDLAIM